MIMAENVFELGDENFDSEIKSGKWAVDFWASWCGPCKMMAPHFEEAASESSDVKFGKVDTQAYPAIAQKYEIRSIPCIIFYKDGEEVGRSIGLVDKEELVERMNDAFK